MTSIKCAECGLINWSEASSCKRCKVPLNELSSTTHQQLEDMSYPSYSSYTPPPIVETEELKEANKHIKGAYITGLVCGVLTLLVVLIAVSTQKEIMGIDGWSFFDVVLIFGLAFGIYRKSRTCAVIMLVYYLICKLIQISTTGKPTGMIMAFLFIYYFAKGVQGTFSYHRLVSREEH
jgi:hypothetical protein